MLSTIDRDRAVIHALVWRNDATPCGAAWDRVFRLPEPYDLILLWTRFLPLDVVLAMECEELLYRERVEDAAVYEGMWGRERVEVPIDLYTMTCNYAVIRRPLRWIRDSEAARRWVFITQGGDRRLDERDVLRAYIDSLVAHIR